MAEIITGKARLEQVSSRLWMTLENQLVQLDNGDLLIAPRYLYTDNNTNPFGDNDLADVRASHFHDIGCDYHQLIYVTCSLETLISENYLYYDEGNRLILKNLPLDYIAIEKCTYSQVNKVFRQILKASGINKLKLVLMVWAVWHNIKYFFKHPKPLDKYILFKYPYGKV